MNNVHSFFKKWSSIHYFLLTFLILLIFLFLYIIYLFYEENQKITQYQVLISQLDLQHAEITKQQKEWKKVSDTYQKMKDFQLFIPEKRLVWIEKTQNIALSLGGSDFQYTLKPQKKLLLPATLVPRPQKTKIYATHMILKFFIPQEEILIRFVHALNQAKIGYFLVKKYTLERTHSTALTLILELEWLNFYEEKSETETNHLLQKKENIDEESI